MVHHRCITAVLAVILFTAITAASGLSAALSDMAGFDDDVKAVMIVRRGYQEVLERCRASQEIFSAKRTAADRVLRRDEKETLWGAWSSVLDYTITLDGLRARYNSFNSVKGNKGKKQAFAVYDECFLAQYRFALEFIELVEKNPNLDTVLNEEVPEMGLSRDTYKHFKFRFLNAARASEFTAMQVLEKIYGKGPEALKKANREDSAAILKMGAGKGPLLTVGNAMDIIKKGSFEIWFPAQKQVSTWMGDVRVRRDGTALISHDQIVSMTRRLEPGDILIERREWYLSNLGLPGFWTHAALYVGTPDERRAYFNTPDVQSWVRAQGVRSGDFEELLRTRYREASLSAGKSDTKGNGYRVLEAISEGVLFTSLQHTAEADSFAVLRPRLDKREKALAILKGFHYFGRPYDFNFDFLTDSSLVCSELVYKVYEPSKDGKGVRFRTERLMGRTLVTPNTMARQFAEEKKAERQMDLVIFLDGYEKSNTAVEADEKAFSTTWKRPKWHIIFQGDAPAADNGPAAKR